MKKASNLFSFFVLLLFAITMVLPAGFILAVSAAQAVVSSNNLLLNSSIETQGASSREALNWHPFHKGYRRVKARHTGRWSIRLRNANFSEMSGAWQRIDLQQTEVKPVFIGGWVKGGRIVNAPGGYYGASMYAEIHLADGTVKYWNSIANTGSFGWRWIGFNTREISLDGVNKFIDQPIDHIFVVPILSQATGAAYFDDITAREYEPTAAAVTLMFDDGETSTYTEAKPALENYDFPGTSAIITSYVNDSGFMNWTEIKDLQANGWEIAAHSITHRDLTALPARQLKRELYSSKRQLIRRGLRVNNFVYPYGAYNAYTNYQASRWYSSARGYELGDNPQGAYPFTVKVRSVINTTPLSVVQGWLAEAQANKTWVVIVFHTIAATGDDAYYVTPEMFNKMVDAVAASGISVVTYNQGLNQFRASK